MTPAEIAMGWLFGHVDAEPAPSGPIDSPRATLERVVLEAMSRQPCGVAFSGGRDSSLVLAVATHVARREGLPDPVPVTRVFPNVGEAEEDRWQELVVRHLGIDEWHRVVIPDGDLDLVGPLAARHLIRDGVVWPPAIAGDIPLVESMPGGSMLDGEGGDEVLGVLAHRIAPVTHLIRHPSPMRWGRVQRAALALAPHSVRAHRTRTRWRSRFTWLRPAGRESLFQAVAANERNQPLSFATSVSMVPRGRAQVLWGRNRKILALGSGTTFSSPLLSGDFVQSLAADGGVLGRGDRGVVLRNLVSDLLPEEVLMRSDKVTFNGCYMSQHTRRFAEQWNGDGVDHELVDAELLRQEWLSEWPSAMTAALLQQAWRTQRT